MVKKHVSIMYIKNGKTRNIKMTQSHELTRKGENR